LCPGPDHSADDRSLSVKPDQTNSEGFVVKSFAGDDWTVCRDYVRSKLGLPEPIKPEKRKSAGAAWTTQAEYIYRDQDGTPHLKVRRCRDAKGKKQFPQYHWNGESWIKGAPKGKLPYRLPELIAASTAMIHFCE